MQNIEETTSQILPDNSDYKRRTGVQIQIKEGELDLCRVSSSAVNRDEAPVKQNRSNPVKKKLLDVTKAKGFRVINDENNIVHNINYTVEFMGQESANQKEKNQRVDRRLSQDAKTRVGRKSDVKTYVVKQRQAHE
ncbi:hypothetical protein RUM43_005635 [Polyplax serrata]|uniref:Uncharacterized protein n=1 Tax=Polyplax serrata TaxID=468196 RepID=A0AAN8NRK3_POLSC